MRLFVLSCFKCLSFLLEDDVEIIFFFKVMANCSVNIDILLELIVKMVLLGLILVILIRFC